MAKIFGLSASHNLVQLLGSVGTSGDETTMPFQILILMRLANYYCTSNKPNRYASLCYMIFVCFHWFGLRVAVLVSVVYVFLHHFNKMMRQKICSLLSFGISRILSVDISLSL